MPADRPAPAHPPSAGKVYQWKDAKGVTHYSDSPPPNQQAKDRRIDNRGEPAHEAAAVGKSVENPQCTTAQAEPAAAGGQDRRAAGHRRRRQARQDPERRRPRQPARLAEAAVKAYCKPSQPEPCAWPGPSSPAWCWASALAWWLSRERPARARRENSGARTCGGRQARDARPSLYRWRDDAGVLQITDKPPKDRRVRAHRPRARPRHRSPGRRAGIAAKAALLGAAAGKMPAPLS